MCCITNNLLWKKNKHENELVWFSNLNSNSQMGLDQAEQLVHLSVLYCTTYWLQPSLRRGFVETCEQIFEQYCQQICEWMIDRYTLHSGVYRVAPATRNLLLLAIH